MLIEVYTDGSAPVADKPGGYAFVVCVDGVKVAEGSGHLLSATNNVAEVTAAIRGLDYIASHDIPGVEQKTVVPIVQRACEEVGTTIVLISDSQLTLKWATGEYRCKKWHLIPLVIELRKLYGRLGATTRWVKGHSGDEHNERCDVLAKAAREKAPDGAQGASSGREDSRKPQTDSDDEVVSSSNGSPREARHC